MWDFELQSENHAKQHSRTLSERVSMRGMMEPPN